jgi:hypothetical protein
MRVPATLVALALLCPPFVLAAGNGQASAPSSMPVCNGVLSILRLSEITPNGSMDQFMAAVAAHQAWYASHGYSDIIFASRVMTRDPQSGAAAYSDKQILTFHYAKPGGSPPTHDAAWDAYVKLYNATSTIKETTLSCVPTSDAPASFK